MNTLRPMNIFSSLAGLAAMAFVAVLVSFVVLATPALRYMNKPTRAAG